MSFVSHLGQPQCVEGSAVGDFYVVNKFDYLIPGTINYLGECKINSVDNENCHYIQYFQYDSIYNLIKILTASNSTTCNTTVVSITVMNISPQIVKITINGDFNEVNVGDSLQLTTPTQFVCGSITEKISSTNVLVLVDTTIPVLSNEVGTVITTDKLVCKLLHSSTSGNTQRRWDHRTRYIYS
jgi:hypothetical protein